MKLKQLLIVISIVSAQISLGQTIHETCSLATKLVSEYKYTEAIALYQRVLFFSESDSITYFTSLKLAELFEKKANFVDAARHYNIAANTEHVEEAMLLTHRLKAALYLLKEKQGKEVIQVLDTSFTESEQKDSLYYKRMLFLGLAFVLEQNRNLAISYFQSFYPLLSKTDSIRLSALNKELNAVKYRNATASLIASLILPGSGQILNGDYKNGINSMLVNGTMIGLSVWTGVSYNWINGVLVAALLAPRYYVGGANMAADAASKRNIKSFDKLFNKYVSFFKEAQLTSF
ncbi:MAG: hypothetical protein EAY81_03700 [Bacteroidetes bacterium]|nr:MAG: hypothetical protein EAY81_03700 [Bacteroidota bacterium]